MISLNTHIVVVIMISQIRTFINRYKKHANQKLFRNAVSIDDTNDDGFIRIVPVGYYPEHHDGAHEVTSEHIRQMEQNFNNSSTDVLYDYDHASMWGESKAAGWSDAVEARDDGLYVRYPEFTGPGQELIDNKEYRYFSPVYSLSGKNKQGKEIGARLVSVAITNTPYFDQGEISAIKNRREEPKVNMTPEFLEWLGVAEDASTEEIEQAVRDKMAELETRITELEGGDAANSGSGAEDDAKVNSVVKDLKKQVEDLSTKLQKRDDSARESEIETLVNAAISEQKILPRDKKAYVNSLRHDFDNGKKELAEIEPGAVADEAVKVNKGSKGGDDTKIVNKTQSAVAALKANRSKK